MELFEEHKHNEKWFRENYDKIIREYDGVFIAIYKKKIIDYAKTPSELRRKILARGIDISKVMIEYISKKPLEFIL